MIVDVSFAHATIDADELVRRGATGVVLYVSDDPAKNATAADLDRFHAAGLGTVLVWEDSELDMLGGAAAGLASGRKAVAQARAIGYDDQTGPIFAANDRNTTNADWATAEAYEQGFAQSVRVPGYYGDQDSIDYLAPRHTDWVYWQSDSTSYGNGESAHAHMLQRFNDPRVAGLPADANDVRIPFPLIGADDMFTQADRDLALATKAKVDLIFAADSNILPAVAEIRPNVQNLVHAMGGLQAELDPAKLAAALAPLIPGVSETELATELAQAIANIHLTVTPPGA